MLRLQIHNDGKEKWQSFEAKLDDSESDIYLEGYGYNKEQAISALKECVNAKIKELQEIDWNSFDWITWDRKIISTDHLNKQ